MCTTSQRVYELSSSSFFWGKIRENYIALRKSFFNFLIFVVLDASRQGGMLGVWILMATILWPFQQWKLRQPIHQHCFLSEYRALAILAGLVGVLVTVEAILIMMAGAEGGGQVFPRKGGIVFGVG